MRFCHFFMRNHFFFLWKLFYFFFSSHWIMIFMSQREISSAIVSCFIIWEIKINFKNENLHLLGRLKNYPCLPNPAQKFSFCPGKKAGPHHCICTRKKISREGSLFSCTAIYIHNIPWWDVCNKRCIYQKVYAPQGLYFVMILYPTRWSKSCAVFFLVTKKTDESSEKKSSFLAK